LLLAYLERLIEDEPLRSAIGENARRYALDEYDVERRAADYLSFIREVIVNGRDVSFSTTFHTNSLCSESTLLTS